MQLLIATNNPAKAERYQALLEGHGIECMMPREIGIDVRGVEEGSDIFKNAKRKALAYRELTELPVLGNDAAFYLDGEELDPAKVRRNALKGRNESMLVQEQVAELMIAFYQNRVRHRGEPIPGYWEDCFVLSLPDGDMLVETARRPVLLTDQICGEVNAHFPIRSLYKSSATGKYPHEQTDEEKGIEMKPISNALLRLVKTT